jgi:hypothetical protein
MPESVSFRVTTYKKLARGETGLTQMASNRLAASEVIGLALAELPEDAFTVSHDETGEIATMVVNWSKVPDCIRNPKIPGRMTHLWGRPS